jgi:hypothetical protein
LYVPLARPLVTDGSNEITAVSDAFPEAPFTIPGLVSPEGATNQLPPLVVVAVAVHMSIEPGAPAFVTATV